jgi:N-acetylglutamate synthase-like GNAT family acetyltransferase
MSTGHDSLPQITIREALREDASAIMELLEPYVQERKLLRRSLE